MGRGSLGRDFHLRWELGAQWLIYMESPHEQTGTTENITFPHSVTGGSNPWDKRAYSLIAKM